MDGETLTFDHVLPRVFSISPYSPVCPPPPPPPPFFHTQTFSQSPVACQRKSFLDQALFISLYPYLSHPGLSSKVYVSIPVATFSLGLCLSPFVSPSPSVQICNINFGYCNDNNIIKKEKHNNYNNIDNNINNSIIMARQR